MVAAAAAIIGDNIGYWIGREGGTGCRRGPARAARPDSALGHGPKTLRPSWSARFFRLRIGCTKTVFIGRFASAGRCSSGDRLLASPGSRAMGWSAVLSLWAALLGVHLAGAPRRPGRDTIACDAALDAIARRASARASVSKRAVDATCGGRDAERARGSAPPSRHPGRVRLPRRGQAAPPPVPSFQHVLVIVMENKAQSDVLGNRHAPHFNALASRYAVLPGTEASPIRACRTTWRSSPGPRTASTTTARRCLVSGRNLADTLEASRSHLEDLRRRAAEPGLHRRGRGPLRQAPRPVSLLPRHRGRTRAPAASGAAEAAFGATSPAEPAAVVRARRSPNVCHDMHDCSVATGDAWLGRFLKPLLKSPALSQSASSSSSTSARLRAGDRAGSRARARAGSSCRARPTRTATSHYGLLRTIEDAWGLPRLGHSAQVCRSPASGANAPGGIRASSLKLATRGDALRSSAGRSRPATPHARAIRPG